LELLRDLFRISYAHNAGRDTPSLHVLVGGFKKALGFGLRRFLFAGMPAAGRAALG